MENVVMPGVDSNVVEGTVLCWAKMVGDAVKEGEVLAEVETEKEKLEIHAPAAGVLHAIFVAPGEKVAVGKVIALVGDASEPLPEGDALPAVPVNVTQRCKQEKQLGKTGSLPDTFYRGAISLIAALVLGYMLLWGHDDQHIAMIIVAVLLLIAGFYLGIASQTWRDKR